MLKVTAWLVAMLFNPNGEELNGWTPPARDTYNETMVEIFDYFPDGVQKIVERIVFDYLHGEDSTHMLYILWQWRARH